MISPSYITLNKVYNCVITHKHNILADLPSELLFSPPALLELYKNQQLVIWLPPGPHRNVALFLVSIVNFTARLFPMTINLCPLTYIHPKNFFVTTSDGALPSRGINKALYLFAINYKVGKNKSF